MYALVHFSTRVFESLTALQKHRLRTAFPASMPERVKDLFWERVRAGRPYRQISGEFFAQAKILETEKCTRTYISQRDS